MTTAEQIWTGAAELAGDLLPLDAITTHPQNPRRGDVDEIKRSLERFGQVRAILVYDGTVIAGNHTYLAARDLGWTHIAVIPNEFASEEEARAYLLADNRLADVGEYDRAELKALLTDLDKTGRYEGTGYQPDDLAHLRALDEAAAAPAPVPPAPQGDPPPASREVVLLLTDEQFGPFSTQLRALRDRYGLEGVTETILRAVAEEALAINQGEAPDAEAT